MINRAPSTRCPEPAHGIDLAASRRKAIYQTPNWWATRSTTLVLLLALALFGDLPSLFAADLRIQSIKVDPSNRIMIDFEAEANTTYALLQGASVTSINTTVATYAAVTAGPAQFALNLS